MNIRRFLNVIALMLGSTRSWAQQASSPYQGKLMDGGKPANGNSRMLSAAVFVLLVVTHAWAQTSAFTYQGRLSDAGNAANGNYDLQFALFDSANGGSQISATQTITNVVVTGGIFAVTLDFGANAFSGGSRFLEINTRPAGAGPFTLLTPRQAITSTPYAVRSATAAMAEVAANSQQLGGVPAGNYIQNSDARLSDARTPAAGSGNYIQNNTAPQASANFNISGDGTAGGTLSANLLNTGTQLNINNNRVFTVTGAGSNALTNTFAGAGAGTSNTPSPTLSAGNFNSFFGFNAGAANTTGFFNSFYGVMAGFANTSGGSNTFAGFRAGSKNTTGFANSFFGTLAGDANTSGGANAFYGTNAGRANTTGSSNSFFGESAGSNNVTGTFNTFVGPCAGCANGFGSHNTFVGENSGTSNSSENYNTFIGANAVGSSGTSNSSAIGAYAKVTESNSLVLGAINGINGATSDTKVGVGTTAPLSRLHVVDSANAGLRVQTNTAGGTVGSFGALGDFQIDSNSLAGGRLTVRENGNVGIGTNLPDAKLDVAGKIRVGSLGGGGITQLCLNGIGEISACSSSLRYKTGLRPFTSGLKLINQLHPLAFKWKADQSSDLGLGAEEVAAVEPLLVTHSENGDVEGVKYDRLGVVLVNAVKEQQAQIEKQQAQIAELKKLVCRSRRRAGVCK